MVFRIHPMFFVVTVAFILLSLVPDISFGQATHVQNIPKAKISGAPGMTGVVVATPNAARNIQLYGVYVPPEKAAQAQKFLWDKYGRQTPSVRAFDTVYGTQLSVNGQDLGKELVKRGYAVPNGVCESPGTSNSAYCNSLRHTK